MPQPLLTPPRSLKSRFEWWNHRLHAVLGAYVLGHFVYRYVQFFVFGQHDMGISSSLFVSSDNRCSNGRNATTMTARFLYLFAPHILLQLSGLQFRLPSTQRHPDGNRIWDEYRWHALCFMARCLALLYQAAVTAQQEDEELQNAKDNQQLFNVSSHPHWTSTMIFVVNMFCVDLITRHFAETSAQQHQPATTTIRGLRANAGLKYLMSATQFYANVHCMLLYFDDNNVASQMSVPLASLVVVQSSAFGMTLRRKGWLGHQAGLVLYSTVLALGMVVIVQDLDRRQLLPWGIALANMAAVLRMDVGCNKYALWLAYAWVVIPMLQRTLQQEEQDRYLRVLQGNGSDSNINNNNNNNNINLVHHSWVLAFVSVVVLLVMACLRGIRGKAKNV